MQLVKDGFSLSDRIRTRRAAVHTADLRHGGCVVAYLFGKRASPSSLLSPSPKLNNTWPHLQPSFSPSISQLLRNTQGHTAVAGLTYLLIDFCNFHFVFRESPFTLYFFASHGSDWLLVRNTPVPFVLSARSGLN